MQKILPTKLEKKIVPIDQAEKAKLNGFLRSMADRSAEAIDNYDFALKFKNYFNNTVAPALKEAGMRSCLRVVFNENTTVLGMYKKDAWYKKSKHLFNITIGGRTLKEALHRDAEAQFLLDNLSREDKLVIRDNLPKLLAEMK